MIVTHDSGTLGALTELTEVQSRSKGHNIITAGASATHAFVLAAGLAVIRNPNATDTRIIDPANKEGIAFRSFVGFVEPGQLLSFHFGGSEGTESFDVVALTDNASFCAVPRRDALHMLDSETILNLAARALIQRQCLTTALAHYSLLQRIVATLIYLHDQIGVESKEGLREVEISQATLAWLANGRRETCSMLLQELRKDKIIDTRYRRIRVLSPEKLESIAGPARYDW